MLLVYSDILHIVVLSCIGGRVLYFILLLQLHQLFLNICILLIQLDIKRILVLTPYPYLLS